MAEHSIDTGDTQPISCVPYRVSAVERRIIIEKVTDMLKQVTKRDVYPLPRLDDVFDRLAGAKYFSSLDLMSGYWQVPVASADTCKTAFVTPDGLYEFLRLPFGLNNAPSTFQRLMDRVLARLKWQMCLVYLDDVIFHLGHTIDEYGIQPDPGKIRALVNFKINNVKTLRAFLGLASFYRRFVPDFATVAHPLHSLLKKNSVWSWTEAQESAKAELVGRLVSSPVLAHFDQNIDVVIQTDASLVGLGAVLMQDAGDGPRPVAFISRKLTDAENSSAVRWLWSKKEVTGKFARWILALQEYDFEIRHIKGVNNLVADALSRNPDESCIGTSGSAIGHVVYKCIPGLPAGQLQPIPPPDRPFHTVGMDHLGPLKVNEWKTQHVFATAEHPQTSGLVERVNRTMTLALAAYVNTDHDDWDHHLPAAIFAINTARQSTTEISPFQLVYGRLPFTALENEFPWPKERPESFNVFLSRVEELRDAARMNIVKKQEKVKRLVGLQRRVVKDLCPGELVLVRRKLKKKNKTKKLLPKYVGPFQVVKKVCPTTYLVEDLPARRKKKRFRRFNAHVVQIRKFHPREDPEWDDWPDEPDDPDESLVQQADEEDNVVAPSLAISPIDPPNEVVAPPPPTKTRAGRTIVPPSWLKNFVK
ncbi:uncharacterized protein LOC123469829 [Daphnia magna]|uniref:uncharacterized protein LOC123469829 n=1 Tax=Daphnia magna TaxID=35525 RepID=UPI001E1BCECB|nr:uncharacterized protein LOC123469829 [Daphnia magna]